ncbi:UbiA family prenyltransferase [Nocardia sp. NPDC004068]|uniref:UbiA family prenyltransferase n=1 Tax=Nocardia sp. NPDC004068 TaxID=3364303 RepID=UPI0036882BB8
MQLSIPVRRPVGRFAAAIAREALVCWSFTWGDLTATVIPATTFALAAWAHSGRSAAALPGIVLSCLIYFWLYIYTFNLSNQLTGIEEDRHNKPHRPLVSGLIDERGARWRLFAVTTVFLAAGLALGVVEWTLMWVGAWIFHDQLGGARRWWGKNAAMVAGTVAQLAAAWRIVMPLDASAWTWIAAIAVPLGVLVSLQDLRDVTGDLAAGRRTAVVVLGDRNARWLFGIAFAGYPVALDVLLYRHAGLAAQLLGGIAAAMSLTISWRVLRLRDRHADNITYVLYTCWYCVTLASAIPALAR